MRDNRSKGNYNALWELHTPYGKELEKDWGRWAPGLMAGCVQGRSLQVDNG